MAAFIATGQSSGIANFGLHFASASVLECEHEQRTCTCAMYTCTSTSMYVVHARAIEAFLQLLLPHMKLILTLQYYWHHIHYK